MSFKRDDKGVFIPTKHFQMPKSAKRLCASVVNKDLRDHLRGMMAQAVMQSFEVIEKKKKTSGGKVVETE